MCVCVFECACVCMCIYKRCAWEYGMQCSHPSRGIPMGMGTKLLKLMGIGRE